MGEQDLPAELAVELDGSFERLVVTYQDRLYAFVLRLIGVPQDAEEIVADTFVRAYQALARYPAERIQELVLRPWLYQIALNTFRNRVRGRRLPLVPLDGIGEHTDLACEPDGTGQPERVGERAELREKLAVLIAALPERYRVAVVLRHIQGFEYGEIGEILGQPVGTVKANVHRGLRRLREGLRAYREWR